MLKTMSKTELDALVEAVYEISSGEDHVMSYSGRFMYGRICVAIETDDAVSCGMRLVHHLMESGCESLALDLIENTPRTDSLGMGTVLYWPDLGIPEDYELDD